MNYPLLAPLILLIGLILYFATEGKPSRAGEICIWLGLGFTLFYYGGKY